MEYVLDRIYRELVCFCDSGILPVLKDQSSFCCSRSLDALLSMCGSASIATSLLSLASVLGAVAHCHHAVHLWESESSDPNDMQRGFGRVWKIKESLCVVVLLHDVSLFCDVFAGSPIVRLEPPVMRTSALFNIVTT